MTMKLGGKTIDIPAAIVAAVGMLCLTAAYIWGPAEHRADLVAGVAGAWGLAQTFMRALAAGSR